MKLPLIPTAATLILALAVVSMVRAQPRQITSSPPFAPPRSDFEQRVAAVGLVESASENISLASHLPGVVEKVFVVVGQQVKKGEPLVRLDTRALEAQHLERHAALALRTSEVAAARGRARQAEAALKDAQRFLGFAESVQDARSISAEELSRRRSAVEIAAAAAEAAAAEVTAAEAGVKAAEAALRVVETDLERSTITAPIDARVLQVRIRPGEYAPAGPVAAPWMILGNVEDLHVRVDIDEHEAWRVRPGAAAVAHPRGNANQQVKATFVRFEPLVVPKVSLTGASTERVDTRVLQAVYRLEPGEVPLFVGQQMEVFIDASGLETALVVNGGAR